MTEFEFVQFCYLCSFGLSGKLQFFVDMFLPTLYFRLANDPTVCRDIVRLGGVDRLVELCKVPAERSYSDAILVACLAVLRRLKTNLNSEVTHVLASLGANDLVKAKLVDSFVEHSTNKQESYV